MSSLRRTAAALALVVASGVGLTACNGDSPSAEPSSTPSSSSPTTSPSPSDGPSVSQADAQGYAQALTTMGKAFQQFSTDFTAAVKKRDDRAVIGTAATLRDAVTTFDTRLQQLDLSALQTEVDRVHQDDRQIIQQLDAATKAKDGAAAIRKLNSIDFQEFSAAFGDLAQKVQTAAQ